MVGFRTKKGLRLPQSSVQSAEVQSDKLCTLPTGVSSSLGRSVPRLLTSPPWPDTLPQIPPTLLSKRGGGSSRKEQITGTEFPQEFCHLSKSNCPLLTGIGSRRKRLLGVKAVDVYALGFYIDQQAAAKTLGEKYSNKSASALQEDQSLCDDVVAADDVEKTVRIVVTSGLVNHDRFLNGLKESLVPACKKAGDTSSMVQFEQLFEGTKFRKGLEIAFTSTKGGGLAARIDNRDVGEVSSPTFTRAFFSLYLGPEPVSRVAKADISSGLASLITSSDSLSQS